MTEVIESDVGKKRLVPLVAAAIVVLLGAVWAFCPRMTAEETQLGKELQSLRYGESVPLSSFTPLKQYDTVCIIDAYAIRSGARQEESLVRIFGTIDYSQFRDEIIRRYSDYYAVGIYPVRDHKLLRAIRISPGHGAYIRAAKSIPFVEPKYFTFGCHRPSDVCLQKTAKDSYGEQPIMIGLCPVSSKAAP